MWRSLILAAQKHDHDYFDHTDHSDDSAAQGAGQTITLADGSTALVATVFDLTLANYGVDNGLGCANSAKSFDEDMPYTPAWQEKITGVPRAQVIKIAHEFADNANKTRGRSMIIIGAAMNHWYNMDMNYRGVINMLMMCGCIGQSGGGWAHYVGQEKLRPQCGWLPLAFGLDWQRPPRQMNGTSFFYNHSDQWRYEKLEMTEVVSPLADKSKWGASILDYNTRAERMGWLPSAPQLNTNPLDLVKAAEAAGVDPKEYAVSQLKSGELNLPVKIRMTQRTSHAICLSGAPILLGSSGKGHEYMLRHLLGTKHGLMNKDLGESRR